jgi:putative phosphoesterase
MESMNACKDKYVVGVISDTHGLLRPEVLQAFKNVDLILHAGDIGGPDILELLQQLAPVTAVRGNMDYGTWAQRLPESRHVQLGNTGLFLTHNLFGLHFGGAGNGIHAVISGHTHRPQIDRRNEVLFMNPGSAGHRRRLYPVSIGLLYINNGRLDAKIIDLDA